MALTAVLLSSLSIWKTRKLEIAEEKPERTAPLGLREILRIPGAKEVMIGFFCCCAIENTAMLWSSTYLVRQIGFDEERAASLASLFFIGMTAGRFISGFMTMKMNDTNLIRLGQGIIGLGVLIMVLPLGELAATVGLVVIGLGCAPIYPCIIHSTPEHFGAENSQALIGVQMASAYTGTLLMPPVFGLIANHISVALFPVFMGIILIVMILMCEALNRKTAK